MLEWLARTESRDTIPSEESIFLQNRNLLSVCGDIDKSSFSKQ